MQAATENLPDNPLLIEKTHVSIGLMPLLDSAPIIWAHHRGYFAHFGLTVHLSHEVSWASLRDRLAYGALDAAQCLAPMILAANLGADQVGVPFTSALTISENWGAITLSKKLAHQLNLFKGVTPVQSAKAVSTYLQQGHHIKLAQVFQFSMHHFLLREWLSLAGNELPQDQVSFSTVTPAQMVNQLQLGMLDGFCVGEPWNTVAVSQGLGEVVANAQAIFPQGADKVLGVTQQWAQQYPNTHQAMVAALMLAQRDLVNPDHYPELSELLEHSSGIDLPVSWLNAALEGASAGHPAKFSAGSKAHPERNDYAWLMLQMLRWKQWNAPVNVMAMAEQCCDLTCFEKAAALVNANLAAQATHQNPPLFTSDLFYGNLLNQPLPHAEFSLANALDYLVQQGWSREEASQILKTS